jgi:hypothetical protein
VTETGFRFKSIAASWDDKTSPAPEPTTPQPTAATSAVVMDCSPNVDFSDSLLSDPRVQLNKADDKLACVPAELIKAKPNGFKFVSLAATWEKEHYVKKKENGFEYRSVAATWEEEHKEKSTGNTRPVHQDRRRMLASDYREVENNNKRQRVQASGPSAHARGRPEPSKPMFHLDLKPSNKEEEMAKKQKRAQRFGTSGAGKNVMSGSQRIGDADGNTPFKLGLKPTKTDDEITRRRDRAKRFQK